MVILGEKGISGLMKILLDIVFYGGIAIFVSLPIILKWYLGWIFEINNENYWFLLVFLYFTGIFCLWLVREMRMIFSTLNRRNPFMMDNVKSLNRISLSAFIIAASYIVKIFLYNSFLTIIIAMVFIIGGLFAVVFAEVFRQAVMVKEENDLTI